MTANHRHIGRRQIIGGGALVDAAGGAKGDPWEDRRERLQQRRGKTSECSAAAYLHFEKQRLTLMHRHAARPADRLAPPFRRQATLV